MNNLQLGACRPGRLAIFEFRIGVMSFSHVPGNQALEGLF
jgi:hypothetical protein